MDTTELKKEAKRLILTASYTSGACHIGSALSCSSIIVDLYFNRMKENDIFIFGKASGVAALYATLALKGVFPKEKVAYYLKKYPLCDKRVKSVFCSTGSLGHGIALSCGVAYADRLRSVYCLLGDADCQEGTIYESALFARQHQLYNLNVIVDLNGIQACNFTDKVLEMSTALDFMKATFPKCEMVRTTKGSNISYLSNKIESHYMNINEEQLNLALSELK